MSALGRRLPGRLARVAVVALLAALAPAAVAAPYAEGETVVVSGVVTDAAGAPLAGLDVTLEASRFAFDYRKLRRRVLHSTAIATVTDAAGRYELEWPWHPYFNRFELVVGLAAGGAGSAALERVDLSKRMGQGSPVVATVVVAEADFVETFQSFLDRLDSDDERQVYQEMGKPDKVHREVLQGESAVSWWYFANGKVYRFRAGRLESVDTFAPVRPL